MGYEDLVPRPGDLLLTAAAPVEKRGSNDVAATLWSIYFGGIWVTRAVVFIGCWIYCIASYGFLFGLGLGWLPSLIAAYLTAWLWPLAVAAIGALIIAVLWK